MQWIFIYDLTKKKDFMNEINEDQDASESEGLLLKTFTSHQKRFTTSKRIQYGYKKHAPHIKTRSNSKWFWVSCCSQLITLVRAGSFCIVFVHVCDVLSVS